MAGEISTKSDTFSTPRGDGSVGHASALSSSLPLEKSLLNRPRRILYVTCRVMRIRWVNDTISSASVSFLSTLITHFPSMSGDLGTNSKSDHQPFDHGRGNFHYTSLSV